jgi:hypothetical protein
VGDFSMPKCKGCKASGAQVKPKNNKCNLCEAGAGGQSVFFDDVLAYATYYYKRSTKDSLKRAIEMKFSQ